MTEPNPVARRSKVEQQKRWDKYLRVSGNGHESPRLCRAVIADSQIAAVGPGRSGAGDGGVAELPVLIAEHRSTVMGQHAAIFDVEMTAGAHPIGVRAVADCQPAGDGPVFGRIADIDAADVFDRERTRA